MVEDAPDIGEVDFPDLPFQRLAVFSPSRMSLSQSLHEFRDRGGDHEPQVEEFMAMIPRMLVKEEIIALDDDDPVFWIDHPPVGNRVVDGPAVDRISLGRTPANPPQALDESIRVVGLRSPFDAGQQNF